MFSHIAKIYVCENEEVAWENVNKAKGHIKRAQLVESNADDVIDSYEIYEDAYCEYALTYKLIFDNLPVMEKLQQKEKRQKDEFDEKKAAILTYVSIGLGILSVVLGFVAFI